jgi:hypothetical protein
MMISSCDLSRITKYKKILGNDDESSIRLFNI